MVEDFGVELAGAVGITVKLELRGSYLHSDSFRVYFDDLEISGLRGPPLVFMDNMSDNTWDLNATYPEGAQIDNEELSDEVARVTGPGINMGIGYSTEEFTSPGRSLYAYISGATSKDHDSGTLWASRSVEWNSNGLRLKLNYRVGGVGGFRGHMDATAMVVISIRGGVSDGQSYAYMVGRCVADTASSYYYGETPPTWLDGIKYIDSGNREVSPLGHAELGRPYYEWRTLQRDVVEDFDVDLTGVERIRISIGVHGEEVWDGQFFAWFDDLVLSQVPPHPDLTIDPQSVRFSGSGTGADRVWLHARVRNVGDAPAEGATITFSVRDSAGMEVVLDALELSTALGPGESTPKTFNFLWRSPHRISEGYQVKLYISNCIPGEANLTNNVYSQRVSVYYADYGSGMGLLNGYHPGRDGYSFENWGTQEEIAQDLAAALTPHLSLPTMFSGVATGPFVRNLILLAATGQWEGHCFGMSASSIAYYTGAEPLPQGADCVHDVDKDQVRSTIISYHNQQFVPVLVWGFQGKFDAMTSDEVRKAYLDVLTWIRDYNLPVTLNMRDPSDGGHSVVAYGVIDLGTTKQVVIYDPNHPDEASSAYFKFDDPELRGGSFSYGNYSVVVPYFPESVAVTLGLEDLYGQFWESTEEYTAQLADLLWQQVVQQITDLVGQLGSAVSDVGEQLWDMATDAVDQALDFIGFGSPVEPLITDEAGRRIGYVDGEYVEEIPGASMEQVDGKVVFRIPTGHTLRIRAVGTGEGRMTLMIALASTLSRVEGEKPFGFIYYKDIPVSAGTVASLTLRPGQIRPELEIDREGDEVVDEVVTPLSAFLLPSFPERLKELAVEGRSSGSVPSTFALGQNYPNPFNGVTVISYDLPKTAHVRLEIYDMLGRRVAVLVDRVQPAGRRRAIWNAEGAASGIYLIRLRAGDFTGVRKAVLLR